MFASAVQIGGKWYPVVFVVQDGVAVQYISKGTKRGYHTAHEAISFAREIVDGIQTATLNILGVNGFGRDVCEE